VKLCKYLEGTPGVSRTMAKQLLRAGTSIGANLEEAQGGQSKADFISKNAIALKEARETCYWLKLLVAAEVTRETRIADLQKEVEELMRIIGAIIVAAKKSQT
jgi:four helix bundle protein